jgi:hypothetical protein
MFTSCEQNAEVSYSVKRANELFEKWQGANVGNDSNISEFHVQRN